MKRTFIFLSLFAAIQSVSALPLSPEEALERLGEKHPLRALSLSGTGGPRLLRTVTTPHATAAVYVFHAGDNTLMFVGADDVALPLLGYTEGEASGEVPPQLEWWLSEYAREIDAASAKEKTSRTGVGETSVNSPMPVRASRPPLTNIVSTSWNQGEPYNNLCPQVGGKACFTGCTATAAAQIAYFHRWPSQGTGSKTYTPTFPSGTDLSVKYTGEVSFDYGATTFDWDNMLPNYYGIDASARQQTAVATLMKAVGVAGQMQYGTDASGAATSVCVQGMKEHMSYHEAAQACNRQNFPLTAWEEMLYENIRQVGPVLYSGYDLAGGGHAFVMDGYLDGYFHINWGWGGAYNGLFSLTALTPAGEGIGANSSGDYSFNQSAVFNIAPAGRDVISLNLPAVCFRGNLTGTVDGRNLRISTDQNWIFINQSTQAISASVGARLVDKEGNATIIKRSWDTPSVNPGFGFNGIDVVLPANLPDGEYKVYAVARVDPSDEFQEISHPVGAVNHFILTVENGQSSITNLEGVNLTVSDLQLHTPLYLFTPFRISYTVENRSGQELLEGFQPYIYTKSAQAPGRVSILAAGSVNRAAVGDGKLFDLAPEEKQSVDQTSAMTCYTSTVPAGQVYLGLFSTSSGEIVAEMPVDLGATPQAPTLEVNSFEVDGDASNVDASDLKFQMDITCRSGYLAAPISVYIYPTSGGTSLGALSSQNLFLTAGSSQKFLISGAFPAAETGKEYWAVPFYRGSDGFKQLGYGTYFTVKYTQTGVESVTGSAEFRVQFNRESSLLSIDAPCGILAIEGYTLDGRRIPLEILTEGNSATVSLGAQPSGIAIIRTILSNGESHVTKIIL